MAQHGIVHHIASASLPDFRFEFHQQTRRLYLIHVGAALRAAAARAGLADTKATAIGELIAERVSDRDEARNLVAMWVKGYRAAKAEIAT